jgi:phage host-nuclease inhibitor protein Gam
VTTTPEVSSVEIPKLASVAHIDPPKPPRSYQQATNLLGEVGDHERAIGQLSSWFGRRIAAHQISIARLQARRDAQIAPHEAFVKTGVKLLATWHKNNLKKWGKGRSIPLPTGELKRELDPQWQVEVVGDKDAAVTKVRRRGIRYLTITVSLNKREIAKDRRRFRRVKELVISRKDRFRAVPNNLGDTEKPKIDRLSLPVKTILSSRPPTATPTPPTS